MLTFVWRDRKNRLDSEGKIFDSPSFSQSIDKRFFAWSRCSQRSSWICLIKLKREALGGSGKSFSFPLPIVLLKDCQSREAYDASRDVLCKRKLILLTFFFSAHKIILRPQTTWPRAAPTKVNFTCKSLCIEICTDSDSYATTGIWFVCSNLILIRLERRILRFNSSVTHSLALVYSSFASPSYSEETDRMPFHQSFSIYHRALDSIPLPESTS